MQIESPSPRVVRVVGVRRLAIAAVAAIACAGVVSACGSSSSSKTNLNTTRVARAIEQSILSQRHVHATVSCPTVVAQEQGKTFECVATTRGTKRPFVPTRTPFAVTVQNSKGDVTYKGE